MKHFFAALTLALFAQVGLADAPQPSSAPLFAATLEAMAPPLLAR